MDTTDVLIFCEMSFKYFDYPGIDRRPSAKKIGDKIGVDERTVRLRTRKMEREGFIQYYQAIPNLQLFGRPITCLCNFIAADLMGKLDAIEKIRREEAVVDIADFLGETFGVTISASSEIDARRIASVIAKRIGIPSPQFAPPRAFPSIKRNMKRIDWQVIKALRYDALKSTREVSRSLGISYRMADYTVNKLFESQVLSTRAIINAKDPKGIIFYSLNLALNTKTRDVVLNTLQRSYGKRVWWSPQPQGPIAVLFLFANSIGTAENDLLEALATPGVQNGTVTIFKGWVEPERPSWIDHNVEERIHVTP